MMRDRAQISVNPWTQEPLPQKGGRKWLQRRAQSDENFMRAKAVRETRSRTLRAT
jgi:hypothetical protein